MICRKCKGKLPFATYIEEDFPEDDEDDEDEPEDEAPFGFFAINPRRRRRLGLLPGPKRCRIRLAHNRFHARVTSRNRLEPTVETKSTDLSRSAGRILRSTIPDHDLPASRLALTVIRQAQTLSFLD